MEPQLAPARYGKRMAGDVTRELAWLVSNRCRLAYRDTWNLEALTTWGHVCHDDAGGRAASREESRDTTHSLLSL